MIPHSVESLNRLAVLRQAEIRQEFARYRLAQQVRAPQAPSLQPVILSLRCLWMQAWGRTDVAGAEDVTSAACPNAR